MPGFEIPEGLLLSDEVAAAVERIRRAVDPETLDEAVGDLVAVALPTLHKHWLDQLKEELLRRAETGERIHTTNHQGWRDAAALLDSIPIEGEGGS